MISLRIWYHKRRTLQWTFSNYINTLTHINTALTLSVSILNTHAQDEEPIPDFTTEIVDITMTEFIDPTAIDESDTTPGATTTSQQPYIPIPQVKIVGGEIVEHREEFAYQVILFKLVSKAQFTKIQNKQTQRTT